ncbi:DUF3048 domain-containing protein [Sporosarcina ureilytica]|uniref:Lipoprotein YerB n=1 Tax=Sporosarcina ureilytica TaxID=298596 RepID=A0A1D8JDI4_9BACL|nr:DUF3048 domain-containing protein [Sporosarcina ureilytica]AOV06770.1 hypothetical protein BI350_03650 [Sporosarcina ureilytica]
MKISVKAFSLLAIMLLLLAACSKQKESEQPNETKEDHPGEIEVELYKAPFTGLMFEEEKKMRPVLATINNHPDARPQSGLSDADMIYELITEGNSTRYLALFQSELPDEIGPIRSARDMFIHMAKGLDAFYIAHGYSPDALALLKSGYVDHVNGMQYDGTLFKRSTDRKAPHNSYISGENIRVAAEQENAPMMIEKMPSLSFHESIESAKIEKNASTVTVQNGSHPVFTSTYTYDEQTGSYVQSVNDVQTIDKANGKPIELTNILVFEAAHQTIDAEGRQAIDLESGGKARLFQAGGVKDIEWTNVDGMLVPVENGVTVKLVPGKTWIHIIKTDPGIEANVSYTP